jgi:hypothetical protein
MWLYPMSKLPGWAPKRSLPIAMEAKVEVKAKVESAKSPAQTSISTLAPTSTLSSGWTLPASRLRATIEHGCAEASHLR